MQKLHKYQVLEKIGVGGFGVVYKATDPFIKRFVAIKTCTTADPETRDRFLREAEIAGNLHHRNIVTVYEFGYEEETPFLVQEYLSGEDLDRKIKRRDYITLPEKILYLVQIARGLQYAHARGVIHRDIKPANIRILEDDTAKIMDFGIAKLAQQQQSLTQAGITLGTAAYLAPEQIRGEPSDPRTDIFSFGALAYELISFERPFPGAEISAIFYKILNETPTPLTECAPDCPPEIARIIMRCLEKTFEKRYASSDLLLRDLEELARKPPAENALGRTGSAALTASSATRPASPASADASGPAALFGAATTAPARQRSLSLGEIELDSRTATPGAASEGLNTMAFHSPPRRFRAALMALGLLLLVAAGGWALWRLREELGGPPRAAAQPSRATPAAAQRATPAPAPKGAPSDTGPATPAVPPGAPQSSERPAAALAEVPAPTPPAASATTSPTTIAPATVEPEPAPAIQPATLVVAPGWDGTMTVRLGKKSWPLDRERRFELEPGAYKLYFALETAAYSHSEEKTVRLRSGDAVRIAPPIERPGRLTVQPHLNTRQGVVRLDGSAVGSTPLRGRWLPPGPHVVEIAANPEPGAPVLLRETVEIASDREAILTFDLEGKLERKIAARSIVPN